MSFFYFPKGMNLYFCVENPIILLIGCVLNQLLHLGPVVHVCL